jgi:hypothetical protein
MRVLVLICALTPLAAGAQTLPLAPGIYVGTDTGCDGGHPGNTFRLGPTERGYRLGYVTSYTDLSDIAATDTPGRFSATAQGGTLSPPETAPPRPVSIEIRGQNAFALINPNGSVYPDALWCRPD